MIIPELATQYGFILDGIGAHSSRTIMLEEIRMLLEACPMEALEDEYHAAIVKKNVLMKRTESTRKESFRRLRELYGISPDIPIFRVMRTLWPYSKDAQPVLAMACSMARDPVLRSTFKKVVDTPTDNVLLPQDLETAISERYPGRFNETTLANFGRHIASSWKKSGHLQGHSNKTRAKVMSRPTSVAYSLFLGYLCGLRGEALLHSSWVRLFDEPAHTIRESCIQASMQGWLEYRYAGGVTDISFHLFSNEGNNE